MRKINVIIPVFNGEKYIIRCINSILSQSYKYFEIICINDGSTDSTLSLLEAIKDERLKVINQKNNGVSAARNTALEMIDFNEDSYITFVDADDYIEQDYFEILVDFIEKNSVDLSCCSYSSSSSTRNKPVKHIEQDKILSSYEATNLLISDKTIQSHSPCKLYKSALWKNLRYPVGIAWMEDQATIFKTFYNAKNGVFVTNYAGYHYWQEGTSACRNNKIGNKRVLDSLEGYLQPYLFEYEKFSSMQRNEIKTNAANAFVSVFLMLFPYVKKSKMSKEEKEKFCYFIGFIKNNKLIKKFKPATKKEKMKKMAYIYCRPFYKLLYKLFS